MKEIEKILDQWQEEGLIYSIIIGKDVKSLEGRVSTGLVKDEDALCEILFQLEFLSLSLYNSGILKDENGLTPEVSFEERVQSVKDKVNYLLNELIDGYRSRQNLN